MFRPAILAVVALAACNPSQPEPTASITPVYTPEPVVLQPQSVAEVEPQAEVPVEPEVVESDVVYTTYDLRRGESLAHFARWSELPVEVIAEASGLDLGGTYPVGTEVRVPVSGEARAVLEEARETHRTARVDGYLASRGGALGTDFHQVRSGETAWTIARDTNGIPLWLLEAYNPSADLDSLRPGQELMVPVLADVVVDAE